MPSAAATWRGLPAAARALAVLFLAYSLVHVAYSGVVRPLQNYSLVQTIMFGRPLQQYFREGRPISPSNFRQYGPTFLMGLHPIMACCIGPDPGRIDLDRTPPVEGTIRLSRALYVVDVVFLVLACWFVVASIRLWLAESGAGGPAWIAPAVTLAVVLLWLNYSPMYEVLEVKNVEIWEVCLISAAMYAQLRGRSGWSGGCIAAAALMKWIPGFLFLLLLLRDRRAFVWGCVWLVALLGVSHAIYGPEMGFLFPLLVIKAASGNTIGFTGIANLSLKGVFAKALGTLKPLPGPHPDFDPGSGYFVTLSQARANLANTLGNLCSLGLTGWMTWALLDRRRRETSVTNDLWAWAFAGGIMWVASPILGYEYSILILPAFSVALAMLLVLPEIPGRLTTAALLSGALFLVANIMPRQIVERIIPVAFLLRWTGYAHLKLTEGYYYFGFPMLGALLLLVVLWRLRPPFEAPLEAAPM